MEKKYNLAAEFKELENVKLPIIRGILPPVQMMMRMFKPKSTNEVCVKRIKIKGNDGNDLTIFIMEPENRKRDDKPCLVYYHGGGFIYPAAGYQFELAMQYVRRTGCVVIFPDYRLAPLHKFPAATKDCFSAYEWTLEHRKEIGIDIDKIAVGGDSAGGNLAAVVCIMARDRGIKMPCFQMLIYPVTDRRMNTASSIDFFDAPVWNSEASKKMWKFYLSENSTEPVKYYSPVEASDLSGLPDAYVEVAEFDSLRDEGLDYAKSLKEAGCEVITHQVDGAPHGFELVQSGMIKEESIKRRCKILRKAFGRW